MSPAKKGPITKQKKNSIAGTNQPSINSLHSKKYSTVINSNYLEKKIMEKQKSTPRASINLKNSVSQGILITESDK